MRGRYWAYLSNFPCHRELPPQAKEEALFILELMELRGFIFTFSHAKYFIGIPTRELNKSLRPSSDTIFSAGHQKLQWLFAKF